MIPFSKIKLLSSKNIIVITFIIFITVILAWLFLESSKPLPGEKKADLGRKHVDIGTRVLGVTTEPPTSGDHFADWVRSGIYETPKDDGYLIHSLEHGYVIMSYNCDKKAISYQLSVIREVYAHGIDEEATSSSEQSATSSAPIGSGSAALSESFKSEQCHKLVDQLIGIYEKKGKTRLIVIPRPNMDSRITLTAWNYLDKLGQFDQQRIIKFIDAHLNQGPEKTME